MQLQSLTSRTRRFWIVALAGASIVIVAGIYWFGPQHLFIDRRVDEALPSVVAAGEDVPADDAVGDGSTTPPADAADEPSAPVTRSMGEFRSLAHGTSGTASVVELADGSRFLRIEGLDTDSGPDLRVYLSEAPAAGDAGAFDDAYVDLGGLKGNLGNQNYEIPRGVDLDDVRSVSIWCRRFSVGFGVAPLM